MLSFLRAHKVQAFALFAVGSTLGLTTGYIANAASTGYGACANASDRLALLNSKGACPSGDSRVTVGSQGPAGPSGVVSMAQYSNAGGEPDIQGNTWGFLGSPPLEVFTNSDTAAEVVGTVDEESIDSNEVFSFIGVCYEPGGSSEVFNVSNVEAQFTFYDAQSVSGVVGNLGAGHYYVGLCAKAQSPNLINGPVTASIILAQTTSGVTSGARATPSKPSQHG